MSFIIAMSDEMNIVMAADTKVTSISGLFNHPNIHKIKLLNSRCFIGITGQHKFGEILTNQLLDNNIEYCYPVDIVNILNSKVENAIKLWQTKMGSPPDCTLLIAGVDVKLASYFSVITIDGNDVQTFEISFECGEYRFLFISPSDFSFNECKQLCYNIIEGLAGEPISSIMKNIVLRVSAISKTVNDEIDILTIPLQYI